jgi:hypothetical protein
MLVDELTSRPAATGRPRHVDPRRAIRSARSLRSVARWLACHEAIWGGRSSCCRGADAEARFTPSSALIKMLETSSGNKTIDVLMHHLAFDDLVKELAKAAERGVRVRVIVNVADRAEHTGPAWDRLIAAGGTIRYKQHDPAQFQLMHHKLAIVDDRVVINGSGNWSGSAFFKNFENYGRRDPPDRPALSLAVRSAVVVVALGRIARCRQDRGAATPMTRVCRQPARTTLPMRQASPRRRQGDARRRDRCGSAGRHE